MTTADTHHALASLFSELVNGAERGGNAFILNSGDIGLLHSLDSLSHEQASQSVDGGATIAAHALHLSYGLSLMNRWTSDGGNPFATATWDEAWKTRDVLEPEWQTIRDSLRREAGSWLETLGAPRELRRVELQGLISSIAHVAYHLGAIRQIARSARGPTEGTFA